MQLQSSCSAPMPLQGSYSLPTQPLLPVTAAACAPPTGKRGLADRGQQVGGWGGWAQPPPPHKRAKSLSAGPAEPLLLPLAAHYSDHLQADAAGLAAGACMQPLPSAASWLLLQAMPTAGTASMAAAGCCSNNMNRGCQQLNAAGGAAAAPAAAGMPLGCGWGSSAAAAAASPAADGGAARSASAAAAVQGALHEQPQRAAAYNPASGGAGGAGAPPAPLQAMPAQGGWPVEQAPLQLSASGGTLTTADLACMISDMHGTEHAIALMQPAGAQPAQGMPAAQAHASV